MQESFNVDVGMYIELRNFTTNLWNDQTTKCYTTFEIFSLNCYLSCRLYPSIYYFIIILFTIYFERFTENFPDSLCIYDLYCPLWWIRGNHKIHHNATITIRHHWPLNRSSHQWCLLPCSIVVYRMRWPNDTIMGQNTQQKWHRWDKTHSKNCPSKYMMQRLIGWYRALYIKNVNSATTKKGQSKKSPKHFC